MSGLVLVAIGSNLPDERGRSALQQCVDAVRRLAADPDFQVEAVSRWYRSAPIPASDQPDYINGAISLRTMLSPEVTLAALQRMEAAFGRQRGERNAARTLDLDVLAFGGLVRTDALLTLPHPRLAERAFVLAPLRDVAPQWRHPLLRRTAAELLAALPPQDLSPLPEDLPSRP